MHARFLLSLVFLLTAGLISAGCAEEAEAPYADEMAEQHEGDTPEGTAIVQEPIIPVEAEPVVYGQLDEVSLRGYKAVPTRPDSVAEAMGLSPDEPLPAVLLIHEWWGLNENVEAMARRLAGEGFRVLAVDLYRGDVADNPDRARELMQLATQDQEDLIQNVRAAYQHLLQEHDASQIGVMGWCFGGAMALNTAMALPTELDAAVIYYGRVGEADRDALQRLEMPILGIFGGEDESIPVSDVRTFETTLEDLGKDVQIQVYEGAGHAFANPSGENYVPEAAEDAWERTVAFLTEHLYPASAEQAGI